MLEQVLTRPDHRELWLGETRLYPIEARVDLGTGRDQGLERPRPVPWTTARPSPSVADHGRGRPCGRRTDFLGLDRLGGVGRPECIREAAEHYYGGPIEDRRGAAAKPAWEDPLAAEIHQNLFSGRMAR